MREKHPKHPLGRRLLALTAAICTLGSLTVAPVANAEQAAPAQPETQQQAPQTGKADDAQQAENDAKPADGDTQKQPATDAGSADAAGQDDIPINEEHFPDAKFREYVGRFDTVSLDGSKKPDGYLSQDELDKVTSIELGPDSGYVPWDLKSVQGVEYFGNLTSLTLEDTGITELDVTANEKLRSLDLFADYFLTSLTVNNNAALELLELSGTGLTSLVLPNNPKLRVLDLSGLLTATGGPVTATDGDPLPGVDAELIDLSGYVALGDSLDLSSIPGLDVSKVREVSRTCAKDDEEDCTYSATPLKDNILRPGKLAGAPHAAIYLYQVNDTQSLQVNVTFAGLWDESKEFAQFLNEFASLTPADYTAQSFQTGLEQTSSMLAGVSGMTVPELGTALRVSLNQVNSNKVEETIGQVLPDLKTVKDTLRMLPAKPKSSANTVEIPSSVFAVYKDAKDKTPKAGPRLTIPADGQLTITAEPTNGYTFDKSAQKEWTFEWQSQTVAPKEPGQSGDVLTITPVTGVEYFYGYGKDGKDKQQFADGQTSIPLGSRPVYVFVEAVKGYQFAKDQKTVFGPYSYTAPNPPDNGNNNGGNGNTGNNGGGTTTPSATLVDVARFYNTRSGEHFYTSSPVEQGVLRADRAWRDEGVAFRMASDKGTPVYRLYNPGGKHLFTTSERERDALIKARWNYEGVAFRVPEGASVQVYRLYNPWNGDHLLTTGANERGVLAMHKWHDEGVAFNSAK